MRCDDMRDVLPMYRTFRHCFVSRLTSGWTGHDTPSFWNILSSVLKATGLTRLETMR